MLLILLAKDLRRVWRNPLPALINIALPICITALIALAFGGRTENELEKIKFAVVDEDQSFLSKMLRGAMTQDQAGEHLAPVFVDRATALQKINDNEIGGALIIPTNFTHDYFSGHEGVKLELIKNPAQSIQPAALEELAATAVAALNGLSRNFQAQFPEWHGAFEGDVDHRRVSALIETVGDRLEMLKQHIDPPLVSYEKDTNVSTILSPKNQVHGQPDTATVPTTNLSASSPAGMGGVKRVDSGTSSKPRVAEASSAESKPSEPKKVPYMTQVFAWVLPGMSAMFLLFLANNAMGDLYREMRFRTFERFQTLRAQLLPFVLGKVLFTMVYLLLCATIMLVGGGLLFRVEWQQPLGLAVLVVAYAAAASAIMALLVALVPDERRAATLNSVVSMLLGFAGGCMFPARMLPQFVREHVTPYLPSNWFVEATHQLQEGNAVAWQWLALKLFLVGVVLVVVAVGIFQRRLSRGWRA